MARIRALASVNPPLWPPVDLALHPVPVTPPPELLRELIPHWICPEGRKLAFSSSFLPLYRHLFPSLSLPLSSYRRRVTTLGPFACISPCRKGVGCIPGLSASTSYVLGRLHAGDIGRNIHANNSANSINSAGTVKFST